MPRRPHRGLTHRRLTHRGLTHRRLTRQRLPRHLLARRLVIPPHRPGGQAQYVETPLARQDDKSLAPLLHWALEHLSQPLTIGDLALRQHVTPRTLIRRFHAATGTSPIQWLLAQRVQRARSMLESTDEPLSRIAGQCGLGTEVNLRHHFARLVGVAPTQYRRTFKSQVTPAPAVPAVPG